MLLDVFDTVCNRWTGAVAEVVAPQKDSGLFKGKIKVMYSQSGHTFYTSPEDLVDVSHSAEIIRANKKGKSPSLVEAEDDE
jgi:hypothetical protein